MAEKKAKMTDEERRVLIDEMNKETDEYIKDSLERSKNKGYKYDEGFTSENIDDILATHPAFMTKDPTPEQIEKSPLLQGLQSLQYEDPDDTPEEKATAYKKDGNFQFKCKKYKMACLAYSEALRKKFDNNELRAVLFTNRSAANFYLQNFRSSLLDANQAVKHKPNHIKALVKCCQCCHALKRYDQAITWSTILLDLDEKHELASEILSASKNLLQIEKRDQRKAKLLMKKRIENEDKLLKAIRSRGIYLVLKERKANDDDDITMDRLTLDSLENQSSSKASVYLDEEGNLIWPVMFLYPEYKTTDFVEKCNENCLLQELLSVMFENQADWDRDHDYKMETIEVYFEGASDILYHVDINSTLLTIISNKDFRVKAGTPNLFILSNASSFHKHFVSNYDKVVDL